MVLLLSAGSYFVEHKLRFYIEQFSAKNGKKNAEILREIETTHPQFYSRMGAIQFRVFHWMFSHPQATHYSLQALSGCCRVIQIAGVMSICKNNTVMAAMAVPKAIEFVLDVLYNNVSDKGQAALERIRPWARTISRTISATCITYSAFSVLKKPSIDHDVSPFASNLEKVSIALIEMYQAGGIANIMHFCIALSGMWEMMASPLLLILETFLSTGIDISYQMEQPLCMLTLLLDKKGVGYNSLTHYFDHWIVNLQKDVLIKEVQDFISKPKDEARLENLKVFLERMNGMQEKLDDVKGNNEGSPNYVISTFNDTRIRLIQEIWAYHPPKEGGYVAKMTLMKFAGDLLHLIPLSWRQESRRNESDSDQQITNKAIKAIFPLLKEIEGACKGPSVEEHKAHRKLKKEASKAAAVGSS